ncbi:hypothetical protein [Candidatus Darwinibacter acetoxidans]
MDKEKKSGLVEDREPQGQQKAPSKPQKPRKGKKDKAPIVEEKRKAAKAAPRAEPRKSVGSRESVPTVGEAKGEHQGRTGAGESGDSGGAKSLQGGGNIQGGGEGGGRAFEHLDDVKKRRVLQHYINTGGQVGKSCRLAGISHQTHYNWLANDPDYKAAYALAQERSLDVIEQEIIRRGVKGWKEPIIYQGKVTGHVRRYSDNLLMFLAKRRDPLYRDNPQLALGLKAGGDIRVHLNVPRPGQEPSASEKKRPKVQIDPAVDVEARELPE